MPVPKKHHTHTRTNKRRSHHRLKKLKLFSCSKCGKMSIPHRACPYCGFYQGKEVINVLARLDKKEKKRREKEQAAYEKDQMKKEKSQGKELSLENLSKK